MAGKIYHAENLEFLKAFPSQSVSLIYIDPPFNTGKIQSRKHLKTQRSDEGDRTGFKGQRYKTVRLGTQWV